MEDVHRERATEINNLYTMIDETTGKSAGDTYLIAYAEAYELTIFSREAPRKNSDDLYKIPDVCKELHVGQIYKPKEFIEAIGYKNWGSNLCYLFGFKPPCQGAGRVVLCLALYRQVKCQCAGAGNKKGE